VVVDEGWSRLPEHWCCAFRQAWAAYVAGTIPVGAVVVDPHGVIAAEARNRIFDAGDPPCGQLAGSWLAHAELNAIAQIDAERSTTAEGWAVYSTWEPCPLCAGAITVAFRGRITVGYACPDPLSSGLRVLTDTDIGRRSQRAGGQGEQRHLSLAEQRLVVTSYPRTGWHSEGMPRPGQPARVGALATARQGIPARGARYVV
jgi:tRNA(Arg) A34 adenosine deaminase TadA